MKDRIPLDSLTSDQYDALLDERDQLAAGIPLVCASDRYAAKVRGLEAALERLHAGEEPQPDPSIITTPGQWIWLWNRASSVRRLTVAGRLIEDARQASRCFLQDHEEAVRGREGVNRVRALHVRNDNAGTCEHCSERDYPTYAVPYPCPTIQALDAPKES